MASLALTRQFDLAMTRLYARSLFRWMAFGMLLPVVLGHPAGAQGPRLNVTVHSFDYSGTPSAAIAEAQRAAAMTFLQAGIHILWLNCPVAGSQSASVPDCEARTDATHFVLVVLPERMARRIATDSRQFGLAVLNPEGGFPNHAYVFLHRAVDLAKNELLPWTAILGHLIAHELGHLLLGTNSHFPVGIMRANWRPAEIKQALMGNLSFTPQQVERIRDDVQLRLRP